MRCQDSAANPRIETISFAAYEQAIEKPIRTFLAAHASIDFIVLTKGIPIRIADAPGRGMGNRRPSLDSYLAALDYEKTPGAVSVHLKRRRIHRHGLGQPVLEQFRSVRTCELRRLPCHAAGRVHRSRREGADHSGSGRRTTSREISGGRQGAAGHLPGLRLRRPQAPTPFRNERLGRTQLQRV